MVRDDSAERKCSTQNNVKYNNLLDKLFFSDFPFINNSVQFFILTSLPLHCLSLFLKLFCRTEIVKVSSPLSSNTLNHQRTHIYSIYSIYSEIQNEGSILDSQLFHFIIRRGRISVHTACHRRYVTFFFLHADSRDLSNHGSQIANVIKAIPGLIFKRWELAVAFCANTANYQAVIKTAF